MGWFDSIVDFVGDVAEVVSDPIGTITEVISDPVGAINDAVESVSNVVEGVAPLGGVIGTVVGGPIGGMIGGAAGNLLGGGNGDGGGGGGGPFGFMDNILDTVGDLVPGDLAGVAANLLGGGSLIGAAGQLLDGGLGDVGSSLLGTVGDIVPGIGGGSMIDFVTDCFPEPWDAGNDILGSVLGGGLGIPPGLVNTITETIGDVTGTAATVVEGAVGTITDAAEGIAGQAQDSALGFLDDILPDMPGGLGEPGKLLDGLGQLAESGGLGAALAQLSSDDLSALVTKLVAPSTAAAAGASEQVAQATAPTGELDDLNFDAPMNTGVVPPHLAGADANGDLLGTDAAAAATDAMATTEFGDATATSEDLSATSGLADDPFSADVPSAMGDGTPDVVADVAPPPAPEPEPTEFSQAIDTADAVDQSFDSMFEGLG